MSKTALKQKQLSSRQFPLKFNTEGFQLGYTRVNIHRLRRETRNLLVQVCSANLIQTQETYPLIQESLHQVELQEEEAITIIKEVLSRSRQSISKLLEKCQYQYSKKLPTCILKLKQLMSDKLKKLDDMQADLRRQHETRRKQVISQIQKTILRLERSIFDNSVLLILQLESGMAPLDELQRYAADLQLQSGPKCMVVFQQCYGWTLALKSQLVKNLGSKVFQEKVQVGRVVAELVQKVPSFNNEQLFSCHECRKLFLKRTQNSICLNTFPAPVIYRRQFDPLQYSEWWINKNYFSKRQSSFHYPYISSLIQLPHSFTLYNVCQVPQNLQITSSKKQKSLQGYFCNRILCQLCSATRKPQTGKVCRFCQGNCNCKRCNQNRNLIALLSHYMYQGGNPSELQEIFLFQKFKPKPRSQNTLIIPHQILLRGKLKKKIQNEKRSLWSFVRQYPDIFYAQSIFNPIIANYGLTAKDLEPQKHLRTAFSCKQNQENCQQEEKQKRLTQNIETAKNALENAVKNTVDKFTEARIFLKYLPQPRRENKSIGSRSKWEEQWKMALQRRMVYVRPIAQKPWKKVLNQKIQEQFCDSWYSQQQQEKMVNQDIESESNDCSVLKGRSSHQGKGEVIPPNHQGE